MSTATQRPTPETDAAIYTASFGAVTHIAVHPDFARKLERERDEAREYAERCKQGCINLSFAIDRIDYACGEPNEMEVSDYAVHQNEEHVVQRVKEKLEAMREAIREAHEALDNCIEFINDAQIIEAQWHWEPVKQSKAALAKLQPFLKAACSPTAATPSPN